MNEQLGWARRYHWLAESVEDFVCEPHAAIEDMAETSPSNAQDGKRQLMLLNMVAEEAEDNRRGSAALIRESPDWLLGEIERLTEGPTLFAPTRHPVLNLDVNQKRLQGTGRRLLTALTQVRFLPPNRFGRSSQLAMAAAPKAAER